MQHITLIFICIFVGVAFTHAKLPRSPYQIIKQQMGGVGTEVYEENGLRLYHCFAQNAPAGGVTDTSSDFRLYSGYLVVGGCPLKIVRRSPFHYQKGVEISTSIRVCFDIEIDSSTIADSISMYAICDNRGGSINNDVGIDIRHNPESDSISITPKSILSNNYRYLVEVSTGLKEAIDGFSLEVPECWKFTTIIDPNADNVASCSDNEKLKIEIPGGAFSDDFYVKISSNPLDQPINVSPEHIQEAIQKAASNNIANEILGYYEFVPFDNADGKIDGRPLKSLFLSLPFLLSGAQRAISQSERASLRLRKNINLYRLNEENKLWVRVPGASVDFNNSVVNASVLSFGTYALFVDPYYYVGDAFAYPVPFSPNDNANHTRITFTNLASRCTIKIFTISGELVKELYVTDIHNGEYAWDVKNSQGKALASGVYLYLIESLQDKKTGKIMVIK